MSFRSILGAAAIVVAGTGLSVAQDAGQAEYMDACASCHGADGAGDGPLAELMTVPVPSLKTLSAANDGEYPLLDVIMYIDGRTGIRGHGYPMPVWGSRFKDEAGDVGPMGAEVIVRGRVLSLAYHIEKLQE